MGKDYCHAIARELICQNCHPQGQTPVQLLVAVLNHSLSAVPSMGAIPLRLEERTAGGTGGTLTLAKPDFFCPRRLVEHEGSTSVRLLTTQSDNTENSVYTSVGG